MIWISGDFRSGKYLGEIADVSEGVLRLEGPNLYVDDIYLMNVGLIDDQERSAERTRHHHQAPDEDSRVTSAMSVRGRPFSTMCPRSWGCTGIRGSRLSCPFPKGMSKMAVWDSCCFPKSGMREWPLK